MRATLWSLAALAGGSLAAPGLKNRSWENLSGSFSSETCTDEQKTITSSTYSPTEYPATLQSSSSPSGPGSYPNTWIDESSLSPSSSKYTPTKSSAISKPSASGPGSSSFSSLRKPISSKRKSGSFMTSLSASPTPTSTDCEDYTHITATHFTTTYTTTCEDETTTVIGGSISTYTHTATETITATFVSTLTFYPGSTPTSYGPWESSSAHEHGHHGQGPHHHTEGPYDHHTWGSSSASAYGPETTSFSAGGYGSETTSPAPYQTMTTITTIYATVYPWTSTSLSSDKTLTSTYETTETITSIYTSTVTEKELSSATGPGGYSPPESSSAGGYVGPSSSSAAPHYTLTTVTSIFTTVYPCTTSSISSDYTWTSTYETTETITSIYTSPCTEEKTSWVTVPWGTTTFKYTVPVTTSSSSLLPYETSSSPLETTSPKPYETTSKKGWRPTLSGSVKPSLSASIKPSIPGSIKVSPTRSTKSPLSVTSVKPSLSGSVKPSLSGYVRPSLSGSIIKTTATSTSTCSKPTATPEECIPCEGQPGADPEKWCGYTINDNSYEVTPKTCKTVEYFFEITNTTVAPDGVSRLGLLVNNQLPGPMIEANWGDTIVVHVTNNMAHNGTSIHFHGMRQYYTNEMDGVPSITQCAIAPGDSLTYTFTATNYGSSWYHSHFALQTYEGVFGPMVIHGPAVETYDGEASILVQDWSHRTADELYIPSEVIGGPSSGPQSLDTGLINGLNTWGTDGVNATGYRYQMTVKSGLKYRLRLVNTAIQSTFKFSIDSHKFKVIAADYVPIQPYETTIVNINIGQRYDLIFTADQTPGQYWMRADNQQPCAQLRNPTNIRGIVSYEGTSDSTLPTSTAYQYKPECVDEPAASLVPIVALNAGAVTNNDTIKETVLIGPGPKTPTLYKWTLSGTTFQSQWGDPTLQDIVNNGTIPPYSGRLAITVPKLNEWVYVIIDSPIPLPHPIHLHGHDFFVLAQGAGLYDQKTVSLNLINPPRRDVALLPGAGHLVVAFQSDNPGAWLMHCHIGWHNSMGFALQIIEGMDQIADTVTNSCQIDETCRNWNTYAAKNDIVVLDSGV